MNEAMNGQTVDAFGNPIDLSKVYDEKGFPILFYQEEEDVMPEDDESEVA